MTRLLRGLSLLALLGGLLAATPANAQTPGDGGDCARLRARHPGRVCELVIEGDEVQGGRLAPTGDRIVVGQAVTWPSLIRARTDLRDKIIQSADDL